MKPVALSSMMALLLLAVASFISCNNVDDLDDQAPVLIVNLQVDPAAAPPIVIDDTYRAFIVYYADENWLNPYLQLGTDNNTIITPTVTSFSVYIAVFWDENGNGVLDPTEPCTGYENANHSAADPLTKLYLFPLEWRYLDLALDRTHTF